MLSVRHRNEFSASRSQMGAQVHHALSRTACGDQSFTPVIGAKRAVKVDDATDKVPSDCHAILEQTTLDK